MGDMTGKLMYDYQLSTCPQNWKWCAHFFHISSITIKYWIFFCPDYHATKL